MVSHNRVYKHAFVKTVPDKWWNLCVFIRLSRSHYTGSTVQWQPCKGKQTQVDQINGLAQCSNLTPLLMQWSYSSLALSHWYLLSQHNLSLVNIREPRAREYRAIQLQCKYYLINFWIKSSPSIYITLILLHILTSLPFLEGHYITIGIIPFHIILPFYLKQISISSNTIKPLI